VLSQAQLAFQEPSSSGLSASLASFWQSWDQVASNPTSSAARQGVVDQAQTVVADLQQASQQLQTTVGNTQNQLASTVGQANTLLGEMADLNEQITTAKASGGSANSLIDQRNNVMNQLAADIGATGTAQPDGSLRVSVGGISLVQGSWNDTLSLESSGTSTQLVAQTTHLTLSASSGTTAGLLAAVNQYLPGYQSQLDTVANSLASLVNGQLAAGYTATGAPGQPLFTGSGAAGIGVSSAIAADPTLIAAASTSTLPDASNDGSNAQTIANLFDAPNGPDSAYRGLVQTVGDQVSSVNNQVQAQTSVANAAQQNLQAVTGVNQNSELVNLMNFQQAYQASAKVITTVDTAVQTLLAAI
jgi:flagellar hook-associated protein 1 FlgK